MTNKIKKSGFTLVELMVVMAIIGIMSAVVILQHKGYRDSKALILGEKQVINEIRITQGKTYHILSDEGSFPRGGYGIRFSKNATNYIVFADNNNNAVYDAGEELEIVELPKNVEVSNLKKDGVDVAGPVDLIFKPPYGKVLIDRLEKSGISFIKLEIEINNGSSTKIIKASSSRLIE